MVMKESTVIVKRFDRKQKYPRKMEDITIPTNLSYSCLIEKVDELIDTFNNHTHCIGCGRTFIIDNYSSYCPKCVHRR